MRQWNIFQFDQTTGIICFEPIQTSLRRWLGCILRMGQACPSRSLSVHSGLGWPTLAHQRRWKIVPPNTKGGGHLSMAKWGRGWICYPEVLDLVKGWLHPPSLWWTQSSCRHIVTLQCIIWYDTMNVNSVSYHMGSPNALNRWIMQGSPIKGNTVLY